VNSFVGRRIPLLPAPCLDETFGSWLFRAAASYRTTVREFAAAMVALDNQSIPYRCDFDTHPPEALMISLAKHSVFRRSELERLVVHATGSTLAPAYRDAYCPQCMREDREHGIIYFRRSWLDAWTLTCERHQCLLGRFEPFEYRPVEPLSIGNLFPARPEAYRRNPSVVAVKMPRLRRAGAALPESWLPLLVEMVRHIAGRDLLLIMGSEAANSLVYDLTGSVRLWNAVWHTADHAPRSSREIEAPLGGIELRLRTAYLATIVWKSWAENQHEDPLRALPAAALELAPLTIPFLGRWSREDRDRFAVNPSAPARAATP
jgi:hypothetical protein